MFLVCDKTNSERAAGIRENLLLAGYPCAVTSISEIANYLPLVRIITFTDMLDDIRRTPYDEIRVLAIGDGFVNSALNAERVECAEALLPVMTKVLMDYFHVREEWVQRFGWFCDDGIFLSPYFFQVYGNIVLPTDREYLIFKYLHMTSRQNTYISAQKICRFCYRASKMPKEEGEAAKNLAVHIANLNQKCQNAIGCHLIEAK
ncbi:MAG: hypothetical protein ACI4V1_05470, partial [Eubacteriales bacterium]